MATNFFRRLFPHAFTPAAPSDAIVKFLKNITDESVIAEGLRAYEHVRRSHSNDATAVISIYLQMERAILDSSPPRVRKKYTKQEVRQEVRDAVAIDTLPAPLRVLFLPPMEQQLLLFEILSALIADYIVQYIGADRLTTLIASLHEPLSRITLRGTTLNFDAIRDRISATSVEERIRAFKEFNSILLGEITSSHGENKALEVLTGIYRFAKNTYEPEIVAQLLNAVPGGALETERLAYLSREELERQIKQRTKELKELNEQLEEKVAARTKELTEANRHLQELDRIKSEFISVAAHELRTPLTGVKWALNALLTGKPEPAEQKKILANTLAATDHIIEMANEMLDISRIEENHYDITLTRQPLIAVLQASFERARNYAESKKLRYILRLPQNPLPPCLLDAEKLVIVFDNLIENAINYTPEQGEIEVSATADVRNITVVVKDTGIGIPRSEFNQVFSKFYRAPNAKQKLPNGTGIGLYLSKQIIEKHRGTIFFESSEGTGSIFSVTLPVADHDASERTSAVTVK